jgi:16S rRNA (cytidine1402-2'-O)-methyltransferase
MANLYLIPNLLSDAPWQQVLPAYNAGIMERIKYLIVEDLRNARRFLRKVLPGLVIEDIVFMELNKHTPAEQINSYLNVVKEGNDAGIISEAGCPGVADPGAEIVALAHRRGIQVIPLTGPSSILLALMGSGLNGQNFAFSGYLPVKKPDRIRRIQQLEKFALVQNQTQIFMETPYRNNHLINDLLNTCQPSTLLCIAANITAPDQKIITLPIAEWRKNVPKLDKQPVIFLMA